MGLNLDRLRITAHAWKAAKRRNVSPEEIAPILRNPSVTEPHAGRIRMSRDGLALVVAVDKDDAPVVITILSRSPALWTDGDVAGR